MRQPTVVFGACLVSLAAGCQAVGTSHMSDLHFGVAAENPSALGLLPPAAVQGQLRVELNSLAPRASRSLLSTTADIHHVTIKLTGPAGATATQTLTAAQIAAGQTSFVFPALALGAWTYEVQAYDAASANIGYATGLTTVTGGHVTIVPITLQLAPTLLPASGMGGLTANLTINDGLSATTLLPTGSYITDGLTSAGVWPAIPSANLPVQGFRFPAEGLIKQIDASGQLVDQWTLPAAGFESATASDGAIWGTSQVSSSQFHLVRFAAGSHTGATLAPTISSRAFTPDASGGIWAGTPTLTRIAKDGTIVASTTLLTQGYSFFGNDGAVQYAVDGASNVFALTGADDQHVSITKVSATGQTLQVFNGPELQNPHKIRTDAAGALWALNSVPGVDGSYHFVKYAADGTLAGNFPTELLPGPQGLVTSTGIFQPTDLALDAAGNVWLAFGFYVAKYSPTGQRQALYYMGDGDGIHPTRVFSLWLDPNGGLWTLRSSSFGQPSYAMYQP